MAQGAIQHHRSSNPLASAAPPTASGRFMTTSGPLQVLHEALGNDLGHDLVGVMDALAALKPKGEG